MRVSARWPSSLGPSPPGAQSQEPAPDDFFLDAVAGSWSGTGIVFGNEVELTRTWARDLAGHFVRADMHVQMANGFGFRALAFWKSTEASRYAITWMDELGDVQSMEAVGDPAARAVTIHHVADGDDGGPPEWRRIVYRLTGDDAYEEVMERETADGWARVAHFRFQRED